MENNWQHYRSSLGEHWAFFSVNSDLLQQYPSEKHQYVVQFSLPAKIEECSEFEPHFYPEIISRIFKVSVQLYALPNVLYAGRIFYDGKAQLYFYCENPEFFLEQLSQFEVENVLQQYDPNWEIYFDVLLPSPLEMKINEAEDALLIFQQQGRDLNQLYIVKHLFYFDDERDTLGFIEHIRTLNLNVVSLKYEDNTSPFENITMGYILTLEVEMQLSGDALFPLIETFDLSVSQFSGEYLIWKCDELQQDKLGLN